MNVMRSVPAYHTDFFCLALVATSHNEDLVSLGTILTRSPLDGANPKPLAAFDRDDPDSFTVDFSTTSVVRGGTVGDYRFTGRQ